ncbi:MAG: DUF2889 domain-containing protein [Burkholderiaceae bacterium]|jgi:hypothetical protein|nr:DUF2889 domain-containing protein [Burkholderiaceae bacterium]
MPDPNNNAHAKSASFLSTQKPVERTPLHTRRITCEAFERADGMIDVEVQLQDISPQGTQLLVKSVSAGGAIHDMLIAVTIDRDMLIHDARAHIRTGPISSCNEVESTYAKLKGLHIRAGFRQKVKALVGGTLGCTHLNELLNPLSTTAMQARMAITRREQGVVPTGTAPMPRPALIGTCHTYREDGAAAEKIWPRHRRAGV